MGVNLRDLFPPRPVPPGWYAGKRIAIDGPNVAFRYLTSIRGADGDVLRNAQGRVRAHLHGFVNLVRHLRLQGAEPIVVWDGPVHPRKKATVAQRVERRLDAALSAQEAEAAGDRTAHHKFLRMTTYLDAQMVDDCSRLLRPLGVAVVTADHDGERYAAALARQGHVDAVATEDFDALVAGAPVVLRRAGGPSAFLHHLSDAAVHGLDLERLQQVAILCGTDWHPGVQGFGPKTAVKALAKGDIRTMFEESQAGNGSTRFHQLLATGGLRLEEFDELWRFVASLPTPDAPRADRPDPGRAALVAEEFGIGVDKVMACYC